MTKYLQRAWANIDLRAIDHNLSVMREHIPGNQPICAVIKANAYGHGATQIARHIQNREEIWGFAVAAFSEARDLREAGITKPILILGPAFDDTYHDLIIDHTIRPVIFTWETACTLNEQAAAAGCILPIHLAVDTGMTRIGFPDTPESVQLVRRINELPNLRIEGIFTHFARADEADKTWALQALHRFQTFCDELNAAGIQIPIRHCSNSAAIMELPQAHVDMVRAGITLYGIYPSDEMKRCGRLLKPVMELKSHVSYVKEVPSGVPVSYGGTFVTPKPMKIATIPVGYADGYPRSLSNKGSVLIQGQRVPILGRVCMDQFMVDVTGMEVQIGDEVTLLGRDGEQEITIDELGELSGRFPYEFVCNIGARIPRNYIM